MTSVPQHSRPRVAFITPCLPPALDGVGDYVAHLASEISRQDTSSAIAAVALLGPAAEIKGVRIQSLASSRGARGLAAALRALARLQPRVVVWQYGPFAYGRAGLAPEWTLFPWLVRRLTGARVLVTGHELFFDFGRRGWKGLLWATVQRGQLWLIRLAADGLVVTTQDRYETLRTWWPRREQALWRLPVGTGIEPVAFDPRERERLRRKLGAGEGTYLLGTFSVLNHHASIVTIVRSLPLILRHQSVRLVCLSVRDEREPAWQAARTEARRLGVAEYVLARAPLPAEELSRHLQALDLYLALYQDGSPGHRQGASGRRTTLAAALAHGLPVVSTTGHEFDADLFHHGENVWLLPPCPSAEAVAGAVTTLLADDALRCRLAAAARETFHQHLSWPRLAAAYREVVDQVEVA